jgi:hypothetical protein
MNNKAAITNPTNFAVFLLYFDSRVKKFYETEQPSAHHAEGCLSVIL